MNSLLIRISFVVFTLCVVSTAAAQDQNKLLPVKIDGVWGYADRSGKLVIAPRFIYASDFSEGRAAVSTSATANKCGYIDEAGMQVIPSDLTSCGPHIGGLAPMRKGKKYGYINGSGKVIIPPKWDAASPFSEGLARVAIGNNDTRKYGFIDRTGRVIVKPAFVYAGDFHDGRARTALDTKDGLKLGFIDRQGNWAVKPKYGSVNKYSEGLACVVEAGTSYVIDDSLALQTVTEELRAYYIDTSGRRAFDGYFQHCGDFSDGLAPVRVNGKWAFVDRQGDIKIRTEFGPDAQVGSFHDGMAAVNFDGKAKFINTQGEVVLETGCDWVDNFKDGIAQVKNVGPGGKESFGYIDRQGRMFWKPSN